MKWIDKAKEAFYELKRIRTQADDTRLLIGTLLARNIRTAESMRDAEFKVFSQAGDDGIIQYLMHKLDLSVDTFVEFGVENYEESNTRFLLMHNNWRGLVIDGSPAHIAYIQNDSIYWRYDLTAVQSFITVENINQILERNGFTGRIGLLSVDIDGNDYWVWQAITAVEADIVIAEYNSLFGSERAISIPYKTDFTRINAHYSALYFGASLPALCDLAEQKGYSFIGCNQTGNNAYFVKNERLGPLKALRPQEGYVKARFREGRNPQGQLTFANEAERLKEIKGLPVINTRTGLTETI
ncbi:hypothetical protein GCM10027592_42800 [Spirosoma flavus]